MSWWTILINISVTVVVLILIKRSIKWSRYAGYYQGRTDEARAMREAKSIDDYLFITRDQITHALGEGEGQRFMEGLFDGD